MRKKAAVIEEVVGMTEDKNGLLKIEVAFQYIEAAELFCLRAQMHETMFAEISEPRQIDIRRVVCTVSIEPDKMSSERFWEVVSKIAGSVNHIHRRWL